MSEVIIENPKISVRDLNFYYDGHQALKSNDLDIAENRVTAIIGPSGCGKSTHIRTYNRIFEMYKGQRATGEIMMDGENLLDPSIDLIDLRLRIGMIFQRPTPFPMSIYNNVAYGLRLKAKPTKSELDDSIEESLIKAALWNEVKDKLHESGTHLSGGQQQRLCIARAIAVEPAVLLMDEPASAIDPVGTAKIEELIEKLKELYTIVIVTHNMQQAARISDYTAFFFEGDVIEFGRTSDMFSRPQKQQTEDYITGRFG